MLHTIKYALITALLNIFLSANDSYKQDTDRIHSVRKIVDNIGATKTQTVDVVNDLKYIFEEAKISGHVRFMYAEYAKKNILLPNTYSSALGGIIKYESAQLNGFSAGIASYNSVDINNQLKVKQQNYELSSNKGNYTDIGEIYINYKYKKINFCVGRQVLDTPLADSDDIRMIKNTFKAYLTTLNYDNLTLMAGKIISWQGYDQNISNSWTPAGEYGTYVSGVTYNNILELNLWYYKIIKQMDAMYIDFGIQYPINDHYLIHIMAQYLNEKELKNSGIEASIYGAIFEFVFHNFSINFAYNKSYKRDNKKTFSGFGGGTLFTNMDTMILDNISSDRTVEVIVNDISYERDNLKIFFAYGSFKGKKNSNEDREHIIEQNFILEYSINSDLITSVRYTNSNDKINKFKKEYNWKRFQLVFDYNF